MSKTKFNFDKKAYQQPELKVVEMDGSDTFCQWSPGSGTPPPTTDFGPEIDELP